MKCIILVGGYATRMYPLTINKSKALLEVDGKTILDIIINNIMSSTNEINELFIVTNDTFYSDFERWRENKTYKDKIIVVNDGSTLESNKIGAVNALLKTIKSYDINDDLLVMAGDNILDFSLKYFINYFKEKNKTCVMYHEETRKEKLSKTGVAQLDNYNRVIYMEEKPKNPKTTCAIAPFYIFNKDDIKLIFDIFNLSKKNDAMGKIICNLCNLTKIYAYKMPGNRYDVGSIEGYIEITKNRDLLKKIDDYCKGM